MVESESPTSTTGGSGGSNMKNRYFRLIFGFTRAQSRGYTPDLVGLLNTDLRPQLGSVEGQGPGEDGQAEMGRRQQLHVDWLGRRGGRRF